MAADIGNKEEGSADKKFEAALNSILHMDKRDYPCYVGGLKIASGDERIVTSPVDESIIFGKFQEPEDGLPERAVEVASKAFAAWSAKGREERASIFGKISDVLKKQKYRIAAAVTVSCGMVRKDSIYEAERLIEIIDAGIEKMNGGADGTPAGVWAIISEYNSPLASPMGNAAAAMIAGNTVIIVPPKECPYPVYMMYDIFAQFLPDGVLNVMYDSKGKATNKLTENEDLAGIVSIGRSDRFEDLMFSAVGDDLAFLNEFKGMNPMIVYRPHSMQAAAELAIASAFAYSGQRADSCSKVIITASEQKQFIDQLLSAAKKITVGDPAEKETTVGPVISKKSMESFLDIVKRSKENLVFGGKRMTGETTEGGYYVMPAIFVGLPDDHELNNIDHSLPVLSVQIVNDMNEAADAAGTCEHGQSMGIISKDEKAVEKFMKNADPDIFYVNGPSTVVGAAPKADAEAFLK